MIIPSAVNDADGQTGEADDSDEFIETGVNGNGKAIRDNVLGDQTVQQHKTSNKKSDYVTNSRSHGNVVKTNLYPSLLDTLLALLKLFENRTLFQYAKSNCSR